MTLTSKKIIIFFNEMIMAWLGSKLENLGEFLSTTSTKIDIVSITETSEKEDLLGF